MRIPWTVRISNQSILKEISPEYSLEELMLKLKLQYFGHLMQRTDSLEKPLMLGEIEGEEGGSTVAPQFEKNHKMPPSRRDGGLIFLPDLESNPWSSLQTSQED